MPLTHQQIAEIKRRALAKGITEQEVDLAMPQLVRDFETKMQGNVIDTAGVTVKKQTVDPSIANIAKTPEVDKDGNFITNTVKALVQPAVDYGKFVGESVVQASRAGAEALAGKQGIFGADDINKEVGQLALQDRQIIAQMKAEKDPEKKKALTTQSREINAKIEELGNKAREIGNKNTTFLVDEEKIKDQGAIVKTGAKATAGAAAYAVPSGIGTGTLAAGTVKGAIATGAAAGALTAASNENATATDVATGALFGGAISGTFTLVGNSLKWVFKGKEKAVDKKLMKKIGENLREDATQIRVKPSVYGAKKEKLIQETLNILGISGGPQEKYEQLEPAMKALSNEIDNVLGENPNIEVNVADLANSFKSKLKSEVRTNALTNKSAQKEIEGYLKDLIGLSSDDVVSDATTLATQKDNALTKPMSIKIKELFKLKKLANQDYGSISKKLENNTPLTDREKVAFYARQVLDEAISGAVPKVKELTTMQSHLYDAAIPLSSARSTVPTFRVFGVTIPKHRVIEDALGSGLIKSSDKLDDLLTKWVDPATGTLKDGYKSIAPKDKQLLLDVVSRMSVIASTQSNGEVGSQNQQNSGYTIENNWNNNNGGNNINNYQGNAPLSDNNATIIPQQPVSQHPIPKFREFANKDEMVAAAFADGLGSNDVAELVKLWDQFAPTSANVIPAEVESLLEKRKLLSNAGVSTKNIDAQLAQYGFEPDTSSNLSASTENRVQLATSGLRALDEVETLLAEDPSKMFKNVLPGKLGARAYDSAAFRAVEGLLRARSGAAIPETEVRRYMNANLPKIGDSQEEMQAKLSAFRLDLEDIALSSGKFDAATALGM